MRKCDVCFAQLGDYADLCDFCSRLDSTQIRYYRHRFVESRNDAYKIGRRGSIPSDDREPSLKASFEGLETLVKVLTNRVSYLEELLGERL